MGSNFSSSSEAFNMALPHRTSGIVSLYHRSSPLIFLCACKIAAVVLSAVAVASLDRVAHVKVFQSQQPNSNTMSTMSATTDKDLQHLLHFLQYQLQPPPFP